MTTFYKSSGVGKLTGMASGFEGFPKEGLEFFRKLKKNNKREWFQPRKQVFEDTLKTPMIDFLGALNTHLAKFAPEHIVEPAKVIYRIYRDTRFSNDKTPYKTHVAASLPRQGMDRHAASSYYLSVGADEIEVAGGIYMPGPEQLLAIRQQIAANYKQFAQLVENKALVELMGPLHGDPLTRVPKGFAADDPAAAYLKCRRWIFYRTDLDPQIALTKDLLPEVVKRLKAMAPFVDFLNEPLVKLGAAKKKADRLGEF